MVWWGICTWLCYKFPTKSKSKRILKIDQYLMIYGQELAGVLFFWLTVYIYGPVSISVCVSCLCLSQVGVLSKRMNGSSWYFCIGASFDLSCTLFYRKIRVSLKNKGASLPNFVHNSGLSKFRHHTFIVATCYQQHSLTVELCWSHLRRSTRRACTLNRIVFATRPSVVRQGIARESEARSVCISQVFISQETFSGDENTETFPYRRKHENNSWCAQHIRGDENTETLSNTSTWKRFRIIRLDREPV